WMVPTSAGVHSHSTVPSADRVPVHSWTSPSRKSTRTPPVPPVTVAVRVTGSPMVAPLGAPTAEVWEAVTSTVMVSVVDSAGSAESEPAYVAVMVNVPGSVAFHW